MKKVKKLIMATIVLGAANVTSYGAVFNSNMNGGSSVWNDTANWEGGSLPSISGVITAKIISGKAANGVVVFDGTAAQSSGQLEVGTNASLTINSGGSFTAGNGMRMEAGSVVINDGTYTAALSGRVAYINGGTWTNRGLWDGGGFNVAGTATFINTGTLNANAGFLYLATNTGNAAWDMSAGEINAINITVQASGASTFSFSGGTITAVTMESGLTSSHLTMTMSGLASLVLSGNKETQFTSMIAAGVFVTTGSDTFVNSYDSGDDVTTLSVIPEPGGFSLVAACLALTSVMVRRRS